jgi:thioredoxin-related protein
VVPETETPVRPHRRGPGIGVRRTRIAMLSTIAGGIILPLLVTAFFVLFMTSSSTSVNKATEQLAAQLSGGPVQPFTGPSHTVYYSPAPMPSADAPRADGRATLVWFSSTSCKECQQMEPFVYATAAKFAPRMVFLEKATDRDSSPQIYNVTAVPTFVMLDARGNVLGRFEYVPDASTFEGAITGALGP